MDFTLKYGKQKETRIGFSTRSCITGTTIRHPVRMIFQTTGFICRKLEVCKNDNRQQKNDNIRQTNQEIRIIFTSKKKFNMNQRKACINENRRVAALLSPQ
jgi:hypothetical protein